MFVFQGNIQSHYRCDADWKLVTPVSGGFQVCDGSEPLFGDRPAGYRVDSPVPQVRELLHVFEQVKQVKYRPYHWSEVIQTVAVPMIVTETEHKLIEGVGRIDLMSDLVPNDDIRFPSFDVRYARHRMLSFSNGWRYTEQEMMRAAALGEPLDARYAVHQRRAWDELIDGLVAKGYTNGPISFTGIGNNADVTALSAAAGWATATDLQIIDDIIKMFERVEVDSKEHHYCDTLVLPQKHFHFLTRQRFSDDKKTGLLTRLREEWAARTPGRKHNIVVWDRFATMDGGLPRLMAFDSTDPDVAGLLMAKPYGVDHVVTQAYTTTVYASGRVGQVTMLNPTGAVYLDDTGAV